MNLNLVSHTAYFLFQFFEWAARYALKRAKNPQQKAITTANLLFVIHFGIIVNAVLEPFRDDIF